MKRKPKLPVEETELRADAMPAKPPELSPDECATLDDLEKLMRADASQGIGVPVLEEPSESDLYWEQEYRDEPAPPWESEDEVLAKLKAKKVSKFDEWVRAEVAWADDHHGPQGYKSTFRGRPPSWDDTLRRHPERRDYNAVAVALVVERGDIVCWSPSSAIPITRSPRQRGC